jgi:recombination associated protein RdgC
MSLLEQIEANAFLGEEFLTWLLWRSETRSAMIGVGDMEVHFGGAILLAAPFGEAEEVALKGDNPSEAPELLATLREGKLVRRAQTRWVIEGIEWHVTVQGQTLALSGLKLPLKGGALDAAMIDRRLELLDDFGEAFDRVYAAFLDIRLSTSAWKKESGAMRQWIAGKAASESPPEVVEITDEES